MALAAGKFGDEVVLPARAVSPAGWVGYPGAGGTAELEQTVAMLEADGVRTIVGPLEGSTWGPYRLGDEGDWSLPAFPGEPVPDADARRAFEAAGFQVGTRYFSTIGALDAMPEPSAAVAERLAQRGVEFGAIAGSELMGRLCELHALLHQGFADQPFFAPLSIGGFAQAMAGGSAGDAHYLMADADNRLVGFCRSYLHPALADTWILKSLVRDPGAKFAGLGSHLIDLVHVEARRRGCTRVIHALMHEGNASRRCSARRGTMPLRSYVLFEKRS